MKLNMLYAFLKKDIQVIEKDLEVAIKSNHPVLQQASLHLLQAGGKRIRPVFVLLAAKNGKYNIDVIKNVAVSLELIHMASLVHDDVIDDADLRRGEPTIKSKWDNRIAMYTGDYIFARSIEILAEIKKPEAHQILSNTIVELCIGEIEQIKDKFNWDQDLKTYLRRIRRKTALLIAVCCQLGAIASDVPEHIHKRLYLFGYYVGMAFQITDDILDFTGTEEELGKPAGSDLMQGNITLPALYAIKNQDVKEKVKKIETTQNSEEIEEILTLIRNSGGIEYSSELSNRYLEKAFSILEELPSNRANQTFYNIAKFIGKRNF